VIKREERLQIPPLVWSFVFGFPTGESRALAAFRPNYNSTDDKSLPPGGYYQPLTPSLAEYLRDFIEYGLDEVAFPRTVTDQFGRFRDVMIADGTVLRLHQFLSDKFERRREEQAGARLYLLHILSD